MLPPEIIHSCLTQAQIQLKQKVTQSILQNVEPADPDSLASFSLCRFGWRWVRCVRDFHYQTRNSYLVNWGRVVPNYTRYDVCDRYLEAVGGMCDYARMRNAYYIPEIPHYTNCWTDDAAIRDLWYCHRYNALDMDWSGKPVLLRNYYC